MKRGIALLLGLALILSSCPFASITTFVSADMTAQAELSVSEYAETMVFPADGADYEAYCPACQETVLWKGISKDRLYYNRYASGSINAHFYLADSYTMMDDNSYIFSWNDIESANMCVHLNGKTVTTCGQIDASKSVLNLMGNGEIRFTAMASSKNAATITVTHTGAQVNLYGGTYISTDDSKPVVAFSEHGNLNVFGNTCLDGSVEVERGTLSLLGGNVTGVLSATGTGALNLDGSAKVNKIQNSLTAKTVIKESWNGAAALDFSVYEQDKNDSAFGLAYANNVTIDGEYTGTLTNASGAAYTVVTESGVSRLRVKTDKFSVADKYIAVESEKMAFPSGGNVEIYCPSCQEVVVWKPINNAAVWHKVYNSGYSNTAGEEHRQSHFYVSADFTLSRNDKALIANDGVNTTDVMCYHLNRKTVTTPGGIVVQKSILNMMGKGTVRFNGTASAANSATILVNNSAAILNLYGGTYTSTAENKPALKFGAAGQVNVYGNAAFSVPENTTAIEKTAGTLNDQRQLLEDAGVCGVDAYWEIEDDRLIIGGIGQMYDYTSATDVPWKPFVGDIKAVEICSGITYVGQYAFANCSQLTQITIPDGVTAVGDFAFFGCKKLSEVALPDSLKDLGAFAFCWCNSLESLLIPENVAKIKEYTFSGCTALSQVQFSVAVTKVENHAFYDCNGLTNVTYIGTEAQWNDIAISIENGALKKAAVAFKPKHYHSYEATITPSTCIKKGSVAYICACGDSYYDNELPLEPHTYNGTQCSACGKPQVFVADIMKMTFPADGTDYEAYCPVCNQTVVWKGCKNGQNMNGATASHWYLAEDVVHTDLATAVISAEMGTASMCLHLNGKRISTVSSINVLAGVWNILGNGTIDNNAQPANKENTTDPGINFDDLLEQNPIGLLGWNKCVFLLASKDAEVNLYGGKFQSVTQGRPVVLFADKGMLNLYGAAELSAPGETETICNTVGGSVNEYRQVTQGTCGENLTWTLNDARTLIISGTGAMTNFESDGAPWKECADSIENVIIKPDVSTIGDYAFSGCIQLDSVTIPVSITAVGCSAFVSCEALSDVHYEGTEKQWGGISVDEGNESLLNATIHCHKHNYKTTVTAPTCLTEGYTTYTCHCGDTYVDSYVNALDHSYTTYKSNNNATCTADGTETAKCDRCEEVHTRTEMGSAKGHSYTKKVTKPTCTAKGYTTYTCPCGDTYKADYVKAKGHSYAAATCTKAQTCKVCGTTSGKASGHNYAAATCTKAQTCKVCGTTSGKASGHNYAAATCTKAQTCKVCGTTSGKALGHNYAAATCTKPKTCKVCGTTSGKASGHNYAAATCTKPKTCKVCKVTSGKALGHTYKSGSCTRCKYKPAGAKITTQPVNVAVKNGKTATVTVKATGSGLKYTWYYAKKGAKSYTKTNVTSSSYSVKMSNSINGGKVYCVVTDQYGNSVKSNVVTLYKGTAAKITTQPKSTTVANGKTGKLTIKASGSSLKYSWYIKYKGASSFTKVGKSSKTYSFKMASKLDGAQVYCVVKDKYGIEVKSSVVTLKMPTQPKITTQPVSTKAFSGKTVKFTVKASGDGLKYQWYYAKKGSSKFKKLSAKSATYSVKVSSSVNSRKYYCLVTDKYGQTVKSQVVTLTMQSAAKITTQPKNVSVKNGKTAKLTIKATGDGLKYTWYYLLPGATKYQKASATGNTFSVKMSAQYKNAKAYCVIADRYGNSVKSKTVTLKMK